MQDYLQRNKLLYGYQSGFRANHSTDTCLSQLTGMILNGAENGKHTGMILIDLQKAFDTLDHKILLAKLRCIGFSGKTIKWFHSFLTNRAILVSLGTVFSEAETVNYWKLCCFCYTYMIFCRLCQILIPICMQTTQASFVNIRTLGILKMF